MGRGRKGKKVGSRSRTTRKSGKSIPQATGVESRDNSEVVPALRRSTRSGLRSGPTADSAWSIHDNPELILRKPPRSRITKETAQAEERPESSTRIDPRTLAKRLEALLPEHYRRVDISASAKASEEETSVLSSDQDPEQSFYRSWGYLPPLDEDAVAVMEAIMENPSKVKINVRIGAEKADFLRGLEDRNVYLTESMDSDPCLDHVKNLVPRNSGLETDGEKESHGQLWTLDQAKCKGESNEALFQRTLMMSLIARHHLIYEREHQRCLDFSVEEPWSCPPMPTRAYQKRTTFLTQPKPDLAVCFRRNTIISDNLWVEMPQAIRQLVCYENMDEIGREKVFHFFTIEAKKGSKSADDNVGRRQSLNNATQALHNMFEFFRDAGSSHEEIFFSKVRFFSVVASIQGLSIRVHRATRGPTDESGFGLIMKNRLDYPLRFEYREFSTISNDDFKRSTVFETFEKILIGYGEEELQPLLLEAAKSLMAKLNEDPVAMHARQDVSFYRYGQTNMHPKSTIRTAAASQAMTVSNRSVDMLHNETEILRQRRASTPRPASKLRGKRGRVQPDDSQTERNTRQRCG